MVTFRFPVNSLPVQIPEDLSAARSERWLEVKVPSGTTIRETLQEAGIKLGGPAAAVVNGQASDLDRALKEGDRVEMLPQIAGG